MPENAQRHAVDQDLARTRLQQAEHDLQQSGLAADRNVLTGSDAEIDIAQYEGLALGIVKAQIADLDIAVDRLLIMRPDGNVLVRARRVPA